MPAIKKGESRNEYVSRAIPIIMKEGLTREQAVGKAEGMFSSRKKKRKYHKRSGIELLKKALKK